MKKLFVRLFIALIFIPASVFGVLYHLNRSGFFDLKTAKVSIKDYPSSQQQYFLPRQGQLTKQLGKFKNESLWSLSLREVRKVVLANEWVKSVSIKKSWPHSIELSVEPVEIGFVAVDKAGLVRPLTSQGKLLTAVSVSQAPDAILLKSDLAHSAEKRNQVTQLIRQVPAKVPLSQETISEVRLEKDGFWVKLMRSGIDIKLGTSEIPLKAARVSKVVEYLESHQMDARVIDADLSKKVLVRLRQAP